ncbi:MAG TPA: cytochrome c [Burkholderiales bacterium]|nr:cytochrome c [Burkholderiales bacterium]
MKTTFRHMAAALCGAATIGLAIPGSPAADDELPPFPKDLLGKPEQIEKGHKVFDSICKFCHGKTAYPGKAPKLNPARYTPEFVYDRVTNGFRGMPSWKEQYSDEERRAVTVYIMSKEFSN